MASFDVPDCSPSLHQCDPFLEEMTRAGWEASRAVIYRHFKTLILHQDPSLIGLHFLVDRFFVLKEQCCIPIGHVACYIYDLSNNADYVNEDWSSIVANFKKFPYSFCSVGGLLCAPMFHCDLRKQFDVDFIESSSWYCKFLDDEILSLKSKSGCFICVFHVFDKTGSILLTGDEIWNFDISSAQVKSGLPPCVGYFCNPSTAERMFHCPFEVSNM